MCMLHRDIHSGENDSRTLALIPWRNDTIPPRTFAEAPQRRVSKIFHLALLDEPALLRQASTEFASWRNGVH